MSVYCGGFGPQHNAINMGRCAICGDEFSTPNKVNGGGGHNWQQNLSILKVICKYSAINLFFNF